MNDRARITRLEKAVADPTSKEAEELRRELAQREGLTDALKNATDDRGDTHSPVTRRG